MKFAAAAHCTRNMLQYSPQGMSSTKAVRWWMVSLERLVMPPGRGDTEARRKEYTQHVLEHVDLLLVELAAQRQRFAAPQPPGTPGGSDAPGRRGREGGRENREGDKETVDVPLAEEWVTIDVKRMCSECASQHVLQLPHTSDSSRTAVHSQAKPGKVTACALQRPVAAAELHAAAGRLVSRGGTAGHGEHAGVVADRTRAART